MQVNVLITGASRKVGLIQAFKEALDGSKGFHGRVVGTETDPLSSGLYFCDKAYIVPFASDPEYIPQLLQICRDEKINIIVPTTDIELFALSGNRKIFEIEGITPLMPDSAAVKLCNDKYLAYLCFKEKDIPTARTYLPDAGADGEDGTEYSGFSGNFPLFVKPRDGRGSINCFKVLDNEQLKFFCKYVERAIIQEFLEGPEYTVDILADFTGQVISVVPRERIATGSGVSQKGVTVRDQRIIDFSVQVSEALNLTGPANIQVISTEEGLKVVEVNPRFAGGYPLTHRSGVSYPELILRMYSREELKPCIGQFKDGMVMMRYEEGVFLPRKEVIPPEKNKSNSF